MAFSCPYQGPVSFRDVNDVVKRFVELGADEIDIGDTNGKADPKMVYERFARLRELYPETTFVAHFHDTEKLALANILAALQAGVTKFDSSIAGLGGCPYAPGATGNVATEDVVNMFSRMGIQTGIDDHALLNVRSFVNQLLSHI